MERMVRIDCGPGDAELAALACWDGGAVAVWEEATGDAVVLRAGVPAARVDEVRAGAAALGLEARDVTDEEVVPLPPTATVVEAGGRRLDLVVPADVFGDARHPTTRMCLAVLEELEVAGRRVLDVGCGSGVLGLAAAALGATVVDGVDLSPEAVAATEANAARNGLDVRGRLGSVDAAKDRYDLVLANLSAATLVALAPELRRRGRTLLVSGLLDGQVPAVVAALGAPTQRRSAEGWTTLVVESPPAATPRPAGS